MHWLAEKRSASSRSNPNFKFCCQNGKVRLPPLPALPSALSNLYSTNDTDGNEFRDNIRFYNKALAFTSTGGHGHIVGELFDGRGPPGFKIQGEMYHRLGPLFPDENVAPTFSQLYIYDPSHALHYRMERNPDRRERTMTTLQRLLTETHPAVHVFEQARDLAQSTDLPDYNIRLDLDPSRDSRRYNLPTTQHELAAIVPSDVHPHANSREIIVRRTGGGLLRISECHPIFFSLHFPLLAPRGELAWQPHLPYNLIDEDDPGQPCPCQKRNSLSLCDYLQYRLHPRPGHVESDHIFKSKLLFQEFLVLSWAAAEHSRLAWIRANQHTIRAELYSGVIDAVHEGLDAPSVGRRIVLPSSVTSSPRYMQKNLQDALALLRLFGGSDLFITFTANPRWPEIEQALLPGQLPSDRPDLVARAFHIKFESMMKDIMERDIFGPAIGHVYTVEYQKRGLPHVHLILFLHPSARFSAPETVDRYISTEFPDDVTDRRLLELVQKHMVHGPCGTCCTLSRSPDHPFCSKGFPKPFQNETTFTGDSYVKTRRRDDGKRYNVRGTTMDNRFVVSYSPYLLNKYEAHINVECTTGLNAIKYIYKVCRVIPYLSYSHCHTSIFIKGQTVLL